jgi:L-arabinokinase
VSTIAFYISGHGFGHASRSVEVIRALRRRAPHLRMIVRTSVPAWFFHGSVGEPTEIVPIEVDTGLAQIDSLTIDEDETTHRAHRFYERFAERVAAEAAWLRRSGVQLVLSDVPPLATAAAARAGIASLVIANFTWDWIYCGLERFDRDAAGVLRTIEDAYASTTCALRLPLHGGFEPMMSVVRDIPFVARRSRHGREAVRAALRLTGDRTIVLGSFGGHGVRMPYAKAADGGRLLILLTHFEAGRHGDGSFDSPHVRCVPQHELDEHHLHYEDLVAAADVVVSKPGYGIVSECIANDTALLYTSRGRMIEYDIFVEAMPRLLRCRYVPQDVLLAGRWADAVEALRAQPPAPVTPLVNGAEVAVDAILQAW